MMELQKINGASPKIVGFSSCFLKTLLRTLGTPLLKALIRAGVMVPAEILQPAPDTLPIHKFSLDVSKST